MGLREVCEALELSPSTFYRYVRIDFIKSYAEAKGFSITCKRVDKYKKWYMKKNE